MSNNLRGGPRRAGRASHQRALTTGVLKMSRCFPGRGNSRCRRLEVGVRQCPAGPRQGSSKQSRGRKTGRCTGCQAKELGCVLGNGEPLRMKGRGMSSLCDFSAGCPGNSPSCQNWGTGEPGGQGHSLAIFTFSLDGKRVQTHTSVKIWLLVQQL